MATATDNEIAATTKPVTKDEYIAQLEKENQELKDELVELRRFAMYVRSLKTKDDFLRLRNVITKTNKVI